MLFLQGGDGHVQYRVGLSSDPGCHFDVEETGTVRLVGELDREVAHTHSVLVLAVDDGTPPRTATATLAVRSCIAEFPFILFGIFKGPTNYIFS